MFFLSLKTTLQDALVRRSERLRNQIDRGPIKGGLDFIRRITRLVVVRMVFHAKVQKRYPGPE